MKLGQKVVKRLVGGRTPLWAEASSARFTQPPVPQLLVTGAKEERRQGAFGLPPSLPIKPVVSGKGAGVSFLFLKVCDFSLLCCHRCLLCERVCCESPWLGLPRFLASPMAREGWSRIYAQASCTNILRTTEM